MTVVWFLHPTPPSLFLPHSSIHPFRHGTPMPRYLAAAIVMASIASAPLSAQSDSTPSTPPDSTTARQPGAVVGQVAGLHAGQWAARFSLGSGFYGLGALLFTSPRAAWAMSADVHSDHYEDGDIVQEHQQASVSIGRRWFGAERSRVRPLGGAGLRVNYNRNFSDYSGTESESKSVLGGIYGELGAAIFFAPELSLGAIWGANFYKTLSEPDDSSGYGFSAGYLSVEGTFYF